MDGNVLEQREGVTVHEDGCMGHLNDLSQPEVMEN